MVLRRGRTTDKTATEDSVSAPRSSVQHQLTELHEVARCKLDRTAAIRVSCGIQRPGVVIDLHRYSQQAVESRQRRFPGGLAYQAQGEVRIDAAVNGLLA